MHHSIEALKANQICGAGKSGGRDIFFFLGGSEQYEPARPTPLMVLEMTQSWCEHRV